MLPEDTPDGTSDVPSPVASLDSETRQSTAASSGARVPGRAKRGPLTRNACFACRQKKVKCDGARPTCSRCSRSTLVCSYDSTQEGVTRLQSLREELRARTEALDSAHQLIDSLQRDPEHIPFEPNLLQPQADGESPTCGDLSGQSSIAGQVPSTNLPPLASSATAPPNLESNALVVLNALASGADAQSAAVLARIRLGEPLDLVAATILHGRSLYDSSRQWPSGKSGDDQASATSANSFHPLNPTDSLGWHRTAWLLPLFDRTVWLSSTDLNAPTRPATRKRPHADRALPMSSDGFGNLSFSDAIWTNHFPSDVQKLQAQNVFAPLWAARSINIDATWLDPFEDVYKGLAREVKNGVDVEYLCGPHAFLAALDEEATFRRAPLLSQVCARLTKSLMNNDSGSHATQYAIMWLLWVVLRWMISASPQSYGHMPLLMRPTPDQLFMSHPRLFDFVFSPFLRSFFCHNELVDSRFLAEFCASLTFDWPGLRSDALSPNRITGELELGPLAMARAADLEHWSVGPGIRAYLRNADFFITVR